MRILFMGYRKYCFVSQALPFTTCSFPIKLLKEICKERKRYVRRKTQLSKQTWLNRFLKM